MKMWFDNADTANARAHKAAYEKSVRENRCVKVHAGCYYYKGYEISNDGGTEYPWNWTKYTSTKYMDDKGYTASEEHFAAQSKKECMEQIDYDIGDKPIDL